MRSTKTHTQNPDTDPIMALPFIRNSTRAERRSGRLGRIFWAVTPTGDYGTDCQTGEGYALLALDFMASERCPQIMQWAVLDMLANGHPRSGIEVGFLSTFGRRALLGHVVKEAADHVVF